MSEKKHILVISQYFYPEQFRINDMCLEWVKRGYKVTVLTGIPNYPQGKFYEGYGLHKRRKEQWNGIDIIRIPLIPRGHSSLGMVLNYFSFPVSGRFWNLFSKLKADYVFMFETSPMNQCRIGCWVAKKLNVPLYLYAQDLWPDNVEAVTGIHSRLVLGPIQHMVDKIYRNCTDIFVPSPGFVKTVCARGIDPEKVHYFPQYAEEFYVPSETKNTDLIPADGRIKVVFTGNIGYAQGLDILPKTAEILKKRGRSDLCFVVVGDGRYKEQLLEETKNCADMFVFTDRQPAEKIPGILAACHIAFLSFQNKALWANTIPAKLQSYLACGMPVAASAAGETEKIIREADCGICVPLGDSEKLADALEQLSSADLAALGRNSRAYYLEHFEKQQLMNWLDQYFK